MHKKTQYKKSLKRNINPLGYGYESGYGKSYLSEISSNKVRVSCVHNQAPGVFMCTEKVMCNISKAVTKVILNLPIRK